MACERWPDLVERCFGIDFGTDSVRINQFIAGMKMILDLWLAILLAAVFVFVVSSILHMCVPIHKSDFQGLPNEDAVMESMRAASVEPGAYMFPHCESMQDLAKPEMIEKYNQGPVGHMVVLPNGPFSMGKSLMQWFAFWV